MANRQRTKARRILEAHGLHALQQEATRQYHGGQGVDHPRRGFCEVLQATRPMHGRAQPLIKHQWHATDILVVP